MLSFRSSERADFRDGFFLFFGWIFPDGFPPPPALFAGSVKEKEFFATRGVCDHRAFAPREAPRIANSKRVMILSPRTFVSRVSFRACARGNEFRTTIFFGVVVFRPCLSPLATPTRERNDDDDEGLTLNGRSQKCKVYTNNQNSSSILLKNTNRKCKEA